VVAEEEDEDDVELIEDDEEVVVTDGHDCGSIITLSIVIEASRANRPPMTWESVSALIETAARTFPRKVLPVPRVADDPTFQKTLQG
jgi:hypothetical protein